MRGSKILVTGATGFLGQHVVGALVSAGEKVRALVRRPSPKLTRLGVEQVIGDVEAPASLSAAFQGVTRLYHLAGLVSRDPDQAGRMMRVHVDGTRHVLQAARAAGVTRVVLASSSGTTCVSRDPGFVGDEDSPFAHTVVKGWPYYLSKIYQEELAFRFHQQTGLELVVVSPSLLLGPGDDRGSSTDDVRRFLERKIPIVPDGGLSFVDVRDAARACASAMDRGRPGARYLLGGPNWTFATFFGRLERLAKVPAPRWKIPPSWARLGASLAEQVAAFRGAPIEIDRISVEMSQHFWYLDSSRAARELGFVARDPQDTLLDTVRYIRRHVLVDQERPSADASPAS